VVDDTSVYWTNGGDKKVMAVAKSGGPALTLALDDTPPFWIAQDRTSLFWTNLTAVGTVAKVGGSSASALVPYAGDLPNGIVVDDANIYWTVTGDSAPDGSLRRAPKTGGSGEILAAGLPGPWGMALDRKNIYWVNTANATAGNGSVMRLPVQ